MSHMSARARRAFDRVREQLRMAHTALLVCGDVVREQQRTHDDDVGRMSELVCQLLEADALNEELRASLARMTGRYAEALREVDRLRAALTAAEQARTADVSDEAWAEFDAQAVFVEVGR